MDAVKREYFGGSLSSFIVALGHSEALVAKILRDAKVDHIDPEAWYDFDWAMTIYQRIAREIGPNAVTEVGKRIIETAEFPPGITDVQSLLQSLGVAYRLNARGPDIGDITCTIEGEHEATLEWSTPAPCALNFGIIEGCCARYGARALVEHGAGGCMEQGAPACVYQVSW